MTMERLALLSNENYIRALRRPQVQAIAVELAQKTSGKTDDIASRVLAEASRRRAEPKEPLDEWTCLEVEGSRQEAQHESLGSRLKRSFGSFRSLSGSSRSLRSSRSSSMKVDDSPIEQNIRLVSPRLRPVASTDSIMKDLGSEEPAPVELRPIFEFGSPTQKPASGEQFAKATEAVLKELEARTGVSTVRSVKIIDANQGAGKQIQQAALGLRYASRHEQDFNKLDSIATHHSLRRYASGKSITHLAAAEDRPPVPPQPNINGKRMASGSSMQSLVGPAAKRLRIASDVLMQPTHSDAAMANALREEGFGGAPRTDEELAVARKQETRRLQRIADRNKARISPAKRILDRTTESLRGFGAPAATAKPLPPLPPVMKPSQPDLAQATAARALSHALRIASGSRIPVPRRVSAVANVNSGLTDKVVHIAADENDAASLHSVSGSVLKMREPLSSRIDRPAIRARVHADRQEVPGDPLQQIISPLKKHSSSPNVSLGKVRSSIHQ